MKRRKENETEKKGRRKWRSRRMKRECKRMLRKKKVEEIEK